MLAYGYDTFGSSCYFPSYRGIDASGAGCFRECIQCKHRAKRKANNARGNGQTGI